MAVTKQWHERQGAQFGDVNGSVVVRTYGYVEIEYRRFRESAGVIDLSSRTRFLVQGRDARRFLHGQVTNNVKDLLPGQGAYAAFVTPKGKLVSDAYVYCVEDGFLLDAEPGTADVLRARFEQYIIADEVALSDAATTWGLISVQGPKAGSVLAAWAPGCVLPSQSLAFVRIGEGHRSGLIINHDRGPALGFDIFVLAKELEKTLCQLTEAAVATGGGLGGWDALEMVRIEAGIPRFPADMDETNLAPEASIEEPAISYSKGCYIGQEVISRIHTYGEVTKRLRGLRLREPAMCLPKRGDKLFSGDKDAGYVTSALDSPALGAKVALAYVRREFQRPGTELIARTEAGDITATVVTLPFAPISNGPRIGVVS